MSPLLQFHIYYASRRAGVIGAFCRSIFCGRRGRASIHYRRASKLSGVSKFGNLAKCCKSDRLHPWGPKMTRFVCKSWLCIALVACLPTAIQAWNATGHMTSAKLVWDRMDAGQREAAYQLLLQHPHLKEFFQAAKRSDDVSEREWFFLQASTWPDWLRGFSRGTRPEDQAIYAYHKGPRHYIDIAFVLPADADMFKDRKLDPPEENAVNALTEYVAQLKDPRVPAADRAVALCWLLHIGGDMHQPLHCAEFYSKDCPTGDQGGNLWWVKDGGRPTRLHGYWDGALGSGSKFADIRGYVDLLTRAEYAREKFADRLKITDFMDWAKEGQELARRVVYRNGELPRLIILGGKEPDGQKDAAPELPEGYRTIARDLARQQIALAGYRMTDLIDGIWPRKDARK
jgi:hypothetical protein